MCVSQFREYCKASSFKEKNREQDLKDKNLKVKQQTWHYNNRQWHYITSLKLLRQLAKQGNEYAIAELENYSN